MKTKTVNTKPANLPYCHSCMIASGYSPRDNGVHTAMLMVCPKCGEEKIILPLRHWNSKIPLEAPVKPYKLN